MTSSFGFLSILTLLGGTQGVFLALALLNNKSGDLSSHRILALLTFLFSVDLVEEFFYQTGFFAGIPHLLHVLAPIDLLYGPLIYLYVRQLTCLTSGKLALLHLLPVVVGGLLLLPFYMMPGAEKLALTEALRKGEAHGGPGQGQLIQIGFMIFMLGTVVQIGVYLALSIKRLRVHSQAIRNTFSDIDQINLNWLKYLLIGLSCIYLLYLGDQFFPNLLGINILGDLITVVAVVLIYAMGYLGIRQPLIFTAQQQAQAQPAQLDEARKREQDQQKKDKYGRSGLDKNTSSVFLKELTTFMETNKPYLEGNLALPVLAKALSISPNYLSQIINEQAGINFYDFVNEYRVEEAKRLLGSNLQAKVNILDIALESGFNSKSAFYAAFKKAIAMTPTQYRKTLISPDL